MNLRRFSAGLALATLALALATTPASADVPVTLIVGQSTDGPLQDNIPAAEAYLDYPSNALPLDDGSVVIADSIHNEVRRIDSGGIIHADLGDGTAVCDADHVARPTGLAADGAGGYFVSSSLCGLVIHHAADGSNAIVAGQFNPDGWPDWSIAPGQVATSIWLSQPQGLAYDVPSATLYITDPGEPRVIKVVSGGATLVAGTGSPGFSGDSGPATAAQLGDPAGVAVTDGSIYIADTSNSRIRQVDTAGTISTLYGDQAQSYPVQLAAGPDGQLYATLHDGSLNRVAANGSLTPITTFVDPVGFNFDAAGNVYLAANQSVYRVDGVAAGSTPPPPGPKNWVALGDSYSSGEGVPPFMKGTNTKTNQCHRSTRSYAEDIAASAPASYKLSFHACSGALISDFYNPNHANTGEAQPQLSWLSADTDIVTLTIGGNDAHFADVMNYCSRRSFWQASCQSVWSGAVDSALTNMAIGTGSSTDNVPDLLASIKRKAPNATIYVVGYPRFFSLTRTASCFTGVPDKFFSSGDMKWINGEVSKLDALLGSSASETGATYVDTYNALNKHELCSSKPWVNQAGVPKQYSFHPNIGGQKAIAGILSTALS